MSDYVDTVDIEGTQYDIQDTATKASLENFEEGQNYSTATINTGIKYMDGSYIYKKTIVFTTPTNGNPTFPSIANSQSYPINEDVAEFVKAYGVVVHDNGVRIPLGMVCDNSQWSSFWLRNSAHPTAPNTFGVACGTASASRTAVITILFTRS